MNEVGYNSKREQNVYARRIEKQNLIRYDFAPNKVMQIGEEMELLTHYSEEYERECALIVCRRNMSRLNFISLIWSFITFSSSLRQSGAAWLRLA